ncbi:MAG: hypothetical protein H0W96_06325 [Solirubrobacterales bacterium]|nr:hypothetical protein [Solirubrobacterales bacterium]
MKKKLTLAITCGALLVVTPAALSYGGSYGGGSYGDSLRAASYINGDAGKNADVDPNSSCYRPDQYDMQAFSSAASGNPGNNNVHNDACFLDDRGNKVGKNIGATFQSRGTGYISACPDPDGAGPAIRILRDLDGDGRNDSCYQSSYQENPALAAGNFEYHARVNNTGMAGSQDVNWGMDRDADGRIDGRDDDSIKVDWSADGKSGGWSYGGW